MRYLSLLALCLFVSSLLIGGVQAVGIDIPFSNNDVGLINPTGTPDGINAGSIPAGGIQTAALSLEVVIDIMKRFVAVIAIAYLVYTGIRMVVGGSNEDTVSKGKTSIAVIFGGLLMLLVVDTLIQDVFYGGGAFDQATVLADQATILQSITGAQSITLSALTWLEGIFIILAVGYLMYSGFRLITALGNEEEISLFKTAIVWIAIGFVVILLNEVIIEQVFYRFALGPTNYTIKYIPDAARGIVEVVGVLEYFLQFLALVGFLAMLYGGGMMVLSFGNEERFGRGKQILIAAGIGLFIILTSYTLTSTLTQGTLI